LFLLDRLISRSCRSLAVMIGCGQRIRAFAGSGDDRRAERSQSRVPVPPGAAPTSPDPATDPAPALACDARAFVLSGAPRLASRTERRSTMDRRIFLKTGAALPLAAALPRLASAQQQPFNLQPGAWRTFEITTRVEISPAGATACGCRRPPSRTARRSRSTTAGRAMRRRCA
jgi:hypothetical protein